MSRQNVYKGRRNRQRRAVDEQLIVELVRMERRIQPRLGGRKLYGMLKRELEEAGVKVGRDRFFEVLRAQGLLVEPLPRSPRTTYSRHSLPVFRNRLKERVVRGPNEAWVADLTYVRTEEGYLYLSVIMDAWSRKIVGRSVADTLEAEGALEALEQALGQLPREMRPLHHSDRGCQYCSHAYVERLERAGLEISMTERWHCYENAQAERVIGILKQEYYLGGTFRTKSQARRAIEEAIELYNRRRPHGALNNQTPEQVHEMGKEKLFCPPSGGQNPSKGRERTIREVTKKLTTGNQDVTPLINLQSTNHKSAFPGTQFQVSSFKFPLSHHSVIPTPGFPNATHRA